MAFYKSNHPEVIAACDLVHAEKMALYAAANALAAEVGGKAVYSVSITGDTFYGIAFERPADTMIWMVPERKSRAQRPRKKPKAGATAEQRAAHQALVATWKAKVPTQTAGGDAMFEAIGTEWGQLMFTGISYGVRDGWLYVSTKAKLNDRMTEILGSEYEAATKATKAAA